MIVLFDYNIDSSWRELAGHETVANALAWTFYLLSQNNREERKLHDEVDSILDNNGLAAASDIPKLEYT
jgi:cytochrome P450